MYAGVKQILKNWLPPTIAQWIAYWRLGYRGHFNDWDHARRASTGYESGLIVERVALAMREVRDGHRMYERDSVLFDEIVYSWPLLAFMLHVSNTERRLSVLDFGGSLGSTYYQNRLFLNKIAGLEWSIIEQKNYVEIGKREFSNDIVKFYPTIEECIKCKKAKSSYSFGCASIPA